MNAELNRIEASIKSINERLEMIFQLINMPLRTEVQNKAIENILDDAHIHITAALSQCNTLRNLYISQTSET